jgi:TetR/AcrR family transcriptional regulator, transcriptional repressor of bet genes
MRAGVASRGMPLEGVLSEERAEQRRRQILDAVVDVTVDGGLTAATFRTIAQRAGVSVRLVQYYFGTRNQLLADTLTHVQLEVADLVSAGTSGLGDETAARQVLGAICEAFLPVDERRRRAMLVFHCFGTAALTDESLQGPGALRRAQGLADVLAEQLRRERSDGRVDDDALLLLTAIVGLSDGILAGDITVEQGSRLLTRAIDRALAS